MKRLNFLCILLLFVVASPLYGRTNYVVIGAFKNKNNAVHFTEAARTNHVEANFALNKIRQLYYVFVLNTEDVHMAIQEVIKLRGQTEYTGAWVYHGVLGDEQVHDGVEIKTHWPSTTPASVVIAAAAADTTATKANLPVTKEAAEPAAFEKPIAGLASSPDALTKLFMFKIFTHDKKSKAGSVEVMDVDREKKVNVLKANEPVVVKAINSSGDMRFDCQVAGYRRVTQALNFRNPTASESDIIIEDNTVIVPFELTRLKKGDKQILFNIYFFKDAAIMRPESKYELDELLAMMNENSRYRIKIHGHTNGKAAGKVIEMGETKNFFSLTGSIQSYGSAKQLSEERAVLISDYLVSEGIAVDRMETKAWGGKKPIYPRDHPHASANVRVEVEILAD